MASRNGARAIAMLMTSTVALGLTGCAAEPPEDTVTVLNSATDTAEHRQNQRFFDRCARPHGLRVEQISVPDTQLTSKALRMASSRSLTDILELDGAELPQFAETGGLRTLEDAGVDTSGFSRSAVTLGSYGGKQYGVARAANSLALFYNTDLLKKAGLKPPKTWAELRSTAAKLTGDGHYGMAFSASPDEDGVYQFLPFFWSAGGDEARPAGSGGVDALRLWKRMVAEGSVSKAVVSWNQQDVNDQFVAGRTAMMVNGPWQVPVLSAQRKVDWDVARLPVPERGGKAVGPIGGTVMTVPESTGGERKENAAKVLNCVNSEKNQIGWGEAVYNVPTRTAAARTYARQNPKLAPVAGLVPTARSRTAKVGTQWPTVSKALAGAFQSVLTGRAEPEQALREAQRQSTTDEQ